MQFRFRVRTLDAPWSHTFGVDCIDDEAAISKGNALMGQFSKYNTSRNASVQLDLEHAGRRLARMTFAR